MMRTIAFAVLLFVTVTANPLIRNKIQPAVEFSKQAVAVGEIWKDCTDPGDMGKIIDVKISPDPPKEDSKLTLTATVDLRENLTSGEIDISVKYDKFVSVLNDKLKLCDAAKAADDPCPLKEGNHTIVEIESIPKAPSGHYTGQATAKDSSGRRIICIDLDFHL